MPLWYLYFNKISLYLQSIIIGHPPYSNYNFGTICPKVKALGSQTITSGAPTEAQRQQVRWGEAAQQSE